MTCGGRRRAREYRDANHMCCSGPVGRRVAADPNGEDAGAHGGAVVLQRQPLTVADVDSPLEREADRVADRVMRMPTPGGGGIGVSRGSKASVQRLCPECEEELQRQPIEDEEEEEEQLVQPKRKGTEIAVGGGLAPSGGQARPGDRRPLSARTPPRRRPCCVRSKTNRKKTNRPRCSRSRPTKTCSWKPRRRARQGPQRRPEPPNAWPPFAAAAGRSAPTCGASWSRASTPISAPSASIPAAEHPHWRAAFGPRRSPWAATSCSAKVGFGPTPRPAMAARA